jgi:uncharacterized protein (DUF608 family)
MPDLLHLALTHPWRTGRHRDNNLYVQLGEQPSDDDPQIGTLFVEGLGQMVVDAVNEKKGRR